MSVNMLTGLDFKSLELAFKDENLKLDLGEKLNYLTIDDLILTMCAINKAAYNINYPEDKINENETDLLRLNSPDDYDLALLFVNRCRKDRVVLAKAIQYYLYQVESIEMKDVNCLLANVYLTTIPMLKNNMLLYCSNVMKEYGWGIDNTKNSNNKIELDYRYQAYQTKFTKSGNKHCLVVIYLEGYPIELFYNYDLYIIKKKYPNIRTIGNNFFNTNQVTTLSNIKQMLKYYDGVYENGRQVVITR